MTQTAAAADALYRRVSWRILPLLILCYTFAYLDRVNIGFAKLHMQADVGISEAVYGLAAGIFFLGYVIFEVPSNLLLAKIGTRKTIFRIMVLWGLTSAAMMFVSDAMTFYVLRFLLGVFEAGFAPGIIFYLTYWFPPARMAAAMGLLMLPGPIGSMLGGPVSSWLITNFDGVAGLHGWQWMFLLEGLPCVALGLVVWKTLADTPEQAKWLSADERELLRRDLAVDRDKGQHSFRQVLRDPRVYLLALGYFCLISGLYAVSFWLPTILQENGLTDTVTIGLYSALPYAFAIVLMIVLGRRSDRTGERRLHSSVTALISAAALAVAAFTASNFAVSLIAIVVATACMWASYTVFWSMPAAYLKGTAAAGGIALINSIGLLGGFVSPTLIGFVKDATGSTVIGLLSMVVLLLVGSIAIYANRLPTGEPS
ncbi:D-galactonate transporter [Saccharopolyspora antimicrobica]|uniref:D-galactonate transporter n=1 Tax=Saccharopolyspora antimicrobica TaxID=455193 RepID=A0A1I5AAZ6_9PSEU|nr:MFS transporter [Saccharopolyspora antimicrobica]RKT83215.1 D-galactonate transporter [Saccharopolyspora antimicrobica]SFN59329.1 D-galactonate transporter [Saccharopolyspora antimicrobica]